MIKQIFLLLFFASQLPTFAQQPRFRHLNTSEGLLSDLRLVITEDRQGRLWIGSDEGINVFDGYQLNSYSHRDNWGLINTSIQRIFCDSKGTIWVLTAAGIQFKEEKDSRFRVMTGGDSLLANFRDFGETSDGRLLIAANRKCYRVEPNNKITVLDGLTEVFQKYSTALSFIHFDKDQWLIGFREKLVLADVNKQTVVQEFSFRDVWGSTAISDSVILAVSFVRDSVALINVRTGAVEAINNWTTNDGKPIGGFASSVYPVGKNKYAIGCRYSGVYIIDVVNRSATHLEHDPSNPSSLKSNFCRWIYVTKDTTLFAHTRGISYATLTPPQFQSTKFLINAKAEKYDAGFTSFLEGDPGKMWIGTNSHLALWDKQTGLSSYFPFYDTGANQKTRTIRAVVSDKKGRVWVGSFGGGLGLLKSDGTFEVFRRNLKDPDHSLNGNDIHSIAIDHDSNFVIAANLGFSFFDPIKKQATTFFNDPVLSSISRLTTFGVLVDEDNNWWFAQLNGIYFYNTSQKTLQKIQLPDETVHKQMQVIVSDGKGNIYAGGTGGLYIISKSSKRIDKIITRTDGLISDNVMSMLCDKQGNIWIIGNVGVARYLPSTGELQNFDARDGLEQSNHTFGNAYMTKEGEVYLASSEGFNSFFPDKINVEKKPLRVFVTALEINDSTYSMPQLKRERLDYNQNNFTFSYMAVDFRVGAAVQYRYRLIGYDSAYIYAGKQRTARYTNLPAGSYRFIVEASANAKDWYQPQQEISFTVKRAFWKTWWFLLFLLSAVVLLAYAFFRNRINLINKEARLRSDYEIKLNELENSALRTQMNPHFIFNSLNTINSFINSNDRVQANQYISKFSKLVRLILDHSREKKIVLKDEIEVAELYIQLEQIRFENKFSYSVKLEEVDPSVSEVPPLIIQPFVENAILHGLLPMKGPGHLDISIKREGELLQCTIQDNGIGRTGAKQLKEKSGFYRKSHGMEITMKRIEFFNKEYAVNQPVAITDLFDSNNQPAGTQVQITLAYVETF